MAPGRKSKPNSNEIDATEARDGMVRLERGQDVSEQLLLKVHRLLQPCPPSCGAKGSKGSKDNPQCFCTLIPQEGSYRKKGLWQKENAPAEIGRDPEADKRQGPDVPAGLRNLGNTCYVNAAMQFLFANPDFRHALYMLEPDIAAQDIVKQLRDLCIDHHFGPRSYADPAPFAAVLQLNTAVQQDGQEFLKLLLQKLEHIFAASQQQEVVTVVQRLFRGYFSYVTTCRNCQQPSEGSSRETEYYELPLQVVGMKSLQESMACALASEELVGDNQYFCDICGKKCDAERQMRLRSLPPYLCLSLQRFVFDIQTFDKKKATDKVSIPLLLDVGQVIAATGVALPEGAPKAPDGTPVVPDAACSQYELAAVLIHRGTSASHGHYVAHIRMPDTGIWWRFDDEVAEVMGPTPTKFPPMDHGTTAQAQAAGAGDDSKSTATGSKAKGGASKSQRSMKADDDSDYEVSAAASKKGRSGGARARGRGGARGRGRGRKGAKSAIGDDADAGDVGLEQMTEEDQLQEALRASRQSAVQEQEAAWASLQQQSGQQSPGHTQQQQEQEGQGQLQHELDVAEELAAAEAAVAVDAKGGRKRKTAASESVTAKKPARGRGKAGAAAAATAAAADEEPADADGKQSIEQVEIVSGNAYFVVYRQRISNVGSSTPAAAATSADDAAATAGATSKAATPTADTAADTTAGDAQLAAKLAADGDDDDAVQVQLDPQLLQQLRQLPADVYQQVLQSHQDFERGRRNHAQMKQDAIARIAQRQQEVRSIHPLLRCPEDHLSSGCFLPVSWLESWANSCDPPGHIDNGPLVCEHRQLKLEKPGVMKYISKAAWEALVAEHKGAPCLGLSDTCPTCLKAYLQGLVRSDYLQVLRDELLDCLAVDEQQFQNPETDVGFLVSKSWLTGFRSRQRIGGGSLLPPTAGITCCHGELAPESMSGSAKRLLVSTETWEKLRELWVTQVLKEIAAKRHKAAKAAAPKAPVTARGKADGVRMSDDDDVKIVDKAADIQQEPAAATAVEGRAADELQQQQQQQHQLDGSAERLPNGDAMHVDLAADQEVILSDTDDQQQQQDEQPQGEQRASTPEAAASLSWQFPLPLDGTVEVTEDQLLQHLPRFHSVHAMECPECASSLQQAAAGHQEVKQQLEGQRAAFGKLLSGAVQEVLELGVTYYLVPNDWLATLRAHMNVATLRKASSAGMVPPPAPLPDAIRALLCQCHPESPGLVVPLPEVVNRRGRFSQADPQKDALRVVTEQEWQQLMLYYSGLQLDSTAETKQPEAPASEPAAAEAAGKRSSRGRGRAAKQQQQEQQQQKQEQWVVLQQMIASMADADPAFRGIRATLRVQAAEPAGTTAAAVEVVQVDEQPEPAQPEPADVQQQQEQQEQQQQEQQERHVDANQQQLEQPRQQQQPVEDLTQLPEPKQQQTVSMALEQQKDRQQQQLAHLQVRRSQRHQQAQHEVEAMDVDVVICSPERQHRVSSVDLTDQSPTAAQPQPAAAQADGDLQIVSEQQAAVAVPVVAVNGKPAGGQDTSQSSDVDADPDGLLEALQKEGDWQPDVSDSSKPGTTTRRGTRRGAATGAAGRSKAGTPAADGDSEGGLAASIAAAAALKGYLVTEPGPCQAVLDARAAEMRAAMLVYTDADIMVELIQEADLPTAFCAAGAERRSRRARKDRQPVKVSNTDTLAQLKLKVFEMLSVHPKNQRLYVRGTRLEGDQQTLAQLEVFPDEEVRVVNTNEVPNDDYESVFDGVASGKKRREVETGFRDTALVSGALQSGVPTSPAAQSPKVDDEGVEGQQQQQLPLGDEALARNSDAQIE